MSGAEKTGPAVIANDADLRLVEGLFEALRTDAFDGTGITREAYTARESAALDTVEAEAQKLGLTTERDAGANLVVTLEGAEPDLPFLAIGSHLDSVPQGGNFDGAAGVLAGLLILARFRQQGFTPRRTIKLFGLRGEESSRFGRAYMGSSALLGVLGPQELDLTDRDGKTLADSMAAVGVDVERIRRGEPLLDPARVAGWLEMHIEQGPVLVARDLPIGIVTGIRGNLRHRSVECIGAPGHSGAVPRWLRHDAVFATAELIGHLDRHWRTLLERGRDLVVTCGMMGTDPSEHAIARIPGTVRFSFEVRSQNEDTLEMFYDIFRSECAMIAEERGVTFHFDRRLESKPAVLDSGWIARLKQASQSLGLPAEEIPSGAGHDAAVFANAGVAAAMIFIRNQNGSHNPQEAMDIPDFLDGVAVMRVAIEEALQ